MEPLDGDDELLITDRQATNGFLSEGSVWLYYGTPSGVSAASSVRLDGGQIEGDFGHSAASAGDVNGDGYDDIIVGAIGYDGDVGQEGMAFVYHGGPGGLDTTADWSLGSNVTNPYWGSTVSSAGDVNGDGYADVLVGAYGWDTTEYDEGGVFLVLGSPSGLAATSVWSTFGGRQWDQCGQGLGVGDLNADGYDDIALPCKDWDSYPGSSPKGRIQVWYGGPSGPGTSADWTVEGVDEYDFVGYAAAGLGDIDGDGDHELAVGAPGNDGTFADQGAVWVFLGDPAGLAATPDLTFLEQGPSAAFGTSISGTSDVDGDGFSELLVGVINTQTVYLYEFVDADGDGVLAWLDCDDTRDDVYADAVEVWYDGVDQDCDGRDDDRDGDGLPNAEDCDDEDATVGACDTAADDTDDDDTAADDTGNAPGDDRPAGNNGCGCTTGGSAAGPARCSRRRPWL